MKLPGRSLNILTWVQQLEEDFAPPADQLSAVRIRSGKLHRLVPEDDDDDVKNVDSNGWHYKNAARSPYGGIAAEEGGKESPVNLATQ